MGAHKSSERRLFEFSFSVIATLLVMPSKLVFPVMETQHVETNLNFSACAAQSADNVWTRTVESRV